MALVNTNRLEDRNTSHALPVGAVVILRKDGDVARMVIVQHSRDCDGTPLYMAGKEPIEPPSDEHLIYSKPYMAYRMHVGWFIGNAPLSFFEDTGQRETVKPFDVQRYLE